MNQANDSSSVSEGAPSSLLKCNKTFTLILVGDGGTGKSSFVDRLSDGGYRKDYIATLGMEQHEILVETSVGSMTIIIRDTAGQEKVGPLRDDYYQGVDAALLFFDVSSRITYKNIPQWHKDILRVCSDIPISLCANKVDIDPKLRKVKSKILSQNSEKGMGVFEISVKDKICLKEPIEYILKKLLQCPTLSITGSLGVLLFDDLENLNI